MTAPTDAMRQAVDTLEQNARRIISDCVHLRRIWDEHPDGPVCDDPLEQYRLPDGSVCWKDSFVERLIAGDWFQLLDDGPWHRVVRAVGSESSIGLSFRLPSGKMTTEWLDRGAVVTVAAFPVRSTVTEDERTARFEALDDDPFVMDGPPAEVAPFTGFPPGGHDQDEDF